MHRAIGLTGYIGPLTNNHY